MSAPRLSVWAPLPFDVHTNRVRRPLPFPLDRPTTRLFSRARHALWHGVRAVGLRPGDRLLVPAYHHGSEIEALVRSGFELEFYDVDRSLEPDADELDALVGDGVRALYLTHYLGFPQDVPRWRRWCDERGLLLVEDAAQAWLAAVDGVPLGELADVAIFCLYKTFGLPDGAALYAKRASEAEAEAVDGHRGGVAVTRKHVAWLMSRSRGVTRLVEALRHESSYAVAKDFELGDPHAAPTRATMRLLPRTADASAAIRRRDNYARLAELLADDVVPLFSELPPGASPFVFPVLHDDKTALLERLDRHGIRALDVWSVPHPCLPAERFSRSASLRSRVIGLPVHQELRTADIERIAHAARTRRGLAYPRLEQVDSLDDVRFELDDLAEVSGNIFWTSDWLTLWWQHVADGHRLATYVVREPDGHVSAVLPLYFARERPVRILRFVGHSDSDRLGVVSSSPDSSAAANALRVVLAQLEFDVFVADHLPLGEAWAERLGGRVLRTTPSPVLRYEDRSWEKILASLSANLRQQIGRRERRLVREHALSYRMTTDPDRLDDDLDCLFTLHDARWRGTSTFGGSNQAFHRAFARRALERGWLRLWIAEADGRPAAAWYGFRFGDAELYYQAGRDPAFDHTSIGFVLLVHTVREALRSGATEYRFLEGGEPYKYRLANDEQVLNTIAIAGSATGSALVAAAAAFGRSPSVVTMGRHLMRDSDVRARRASPPSRTNGAHAGRGLRGAKGVER